MHATVHTKNTQAIVLSEATLKIGQHAVMQEVSFSIQQGEFIAVLGPNGAGKTTLMRALLGLLSIEEGTLRVLNAAVQRGNAKIAYLPQMRMGLWCPRLCGFDFVMSVLHGQQWARPWITRSMRMEVERVLELVDATDLAYRSLTELSGGERQRLLLAQCLLGNAQLLLLDEPLISLDPTHQKQCVDLVRRVQQRSNLTVLFSAHELNPLLDSVDRVLYLGGGHAVLGTVDEVITGPVLSKLYGSTIEVLRIQDRIFVMSGATEVEKERHDHVSL